MSQLTRTIEIDLAARKADSKGAKSFPAVISTEVPVRRKDWERGVYDEILSHKASAVNLERAPLPLLESHNARSLPIGLVDSLRIVDGKLRGEVSFGESARAKEIAADVEAGVIRSLSVGYSVDVIEEKTSGDRKTITATRWTPYEVSAVAIGADAGAGFGRNKPMEDEETPTPDNWTPADIRIRELAAAGDDAAAERERCAEISRISRALGNYAELGEQMIREGVSIEEARARLIDHRAAQSPTHGVQPGGDARIYRTSSYEVTRRRGSASWMDQPATGIDGGGDDFRSAAVDALLLRAGVPVREPHPAARDVSASVIDLARTCLSRSGGTVRGGTEKLLKRAMSTSDFPLILGDMLHKATRVGYEDEPASHRAWVRRQPVADFKDQNRLILGSMPDLEKVLEGGEYTAGALNEDAASYRVAKYGKIVLLTWEALVNDDLGAFVRIQPGLGSAARRKEADLVYALLAENGAAGPTMQDGVALFHADHSNLATAGAFAVALLGEGRTLLRKQTALGGGYLSLVPRFLIVPAELETEAEILLAQATKHVAMSGSGADDGAGNTTSSSTSIEGNTPRWLSGLELVVEPRLPDDACYLAANHGQIDTIELGLLEENMGGPQIIEDSELYADIYAWRARHVFGVKALDWRGLVKLPIA